MEKFEIRRGEAEPNFKFFHPTPRNALSVRPSVRDVFTPSNANAHT